MDLTKALAPKSDQLDFADLEGQAPQTFTITEVSENGTELADQQPVNIRLAEFPRWWRPSKGMLRVLADNWGKDVKVWVGRQVELYGDPNVYFGKEKRGGTRISRLSHISASKTTLVNPRGGRGAYWKVDPLPDAPASADPHQERIQAMLAAYSKGGITHAMLEAHEGRAVSEWDEGNVANLSALFEALKSGAKKKADEFPELDAAGETGTEA